MPLEWKFACQTARPSPFLSLLPSWLLMTSAVSWWWRTRAQSCGRRWLQLGGTPSTRNRRTGTLIGCSVDE